MAKKDTVKKTIDVPVELFERIMSYAYNEKTYKFGPACLELLEEAVSSWEAEQGAE